MEGKQVGNGDFTGPAGITSPLPDAVGAVYNQVAATCGEEALPGGAGRPGPLARMKGKHGPWS